MTERDYILAGNYQLLDALYKRLDTAENRAASLNEALASREEMLDLARTQRDRLALELRGVLESNQLLRDARLMGKAKSVIEMRTGGLAYAEQQAREALAALG